MNDQKAAVNEMLTLREVENVQKTWEMVGDSVEMAIDFYNRLFYRYPGLRPLFKEDIRMQARKFTAHLSYLIKNLYDWKRIQLDIEELGKRHVSYEVKEEDYTYVQEALIYALKNHLKDEWDENTAQAWIKLYRMIAELMKSASKNQLRRS